MVFVVAVAVAVVVAVVVAIGRVFYIVVDVLISNTNG